MATYYSGGEYGFINVHAKEMCCSRVKSNKDFTGDKGSFCIADEAASGKTKFTVIYHHPVERNLIRYIIYVLKIKIRRIMIIIIKIIKKTPLVYALQISRSGDFATLPPPSNMPVHMINDLDNLRFVDDKETRRGCFPPDVFKVVRAS